MTAAKKRALVDVVKDPLVKKEKPELFHGKSTDKSEDNSAVKILFAAFIGLIGGFLINRFLRII